MGMNRIVLFFVVFGMCVGCSTAQSSAPDYEITSEKDKETSDLKVKDFKVSTQFTKEQELRQIAKDIRSENPGYDALGIEFQKNTQGNDSSKQTGTATVVNNEEAAQKMLPDLLFTDADRRELLKKDDGILIITRAELKQFEKEMNKATRDLKQDLNKKMDKQMDKSMNGMDREMREMEK